MHPGRDRDHDLVGRVGALPKAPKAPKAQPWGKDGCREQQCYGFPGLHVFTPGFGHGIDGIGNGFVSHLPVSGEPTQYSLAKSSGFSTDW